MAKIEDDKDEILEDTSLNTDTPSEDDANLEDEPKDTIDIEQDDTDGTEEQLNGNNLGEQTDKVENNEEVDNKNGISKERDADYLSDLLRVQAEFDNYRKRMSSTLQDARQDGFVEAIEGFLPALDSFKMATQMITDKNTLMGIQFIEKGILDTLTKMGVEQIDTSGMFDPNLHQAVDTEDVDGVESGMITKELYKGFTYKGKVIRYSQVVVRK